MKLTFVFTLEKKKQILKWFTKNSITNRNFELLEAA